MLAGVDLVDHHLEVERDARAAVVLRSGGVAEDAKSRVLAPAAVDAQLIVAAVAALDLDHFARLDRARVTDDEVDRRVVRVALVHAVDGVVPAEGEADRVRAAEQVIARELAVLRPEG